MTNGALVLAALGAIGLVIWYSMLQDLPAEGGADGRCRQSVAGVGEIAASDRSGDGGRRQLGAARMIEDYYVFPMGSDFEQSVNHPCGPRW